MTHDKIEQITAQNTSVEVDDVEFTINPLTTKEFLKAQVIGENKDEGEAMLHMLQQSLKEEGMSKEDVEEAPAKFTMAVQDAIEEVNDFEDFFEQDEMMDTEKQQ